MSLKLVIPTLLLTLTLLLSLFKPSLGNSPFLGAVILYGFLAWLEHQESSEIAKIKKDLSAIQGKVDSLTMGKAFR